MAGTDWKCSETSKKGVGCAIFLGEGGQNLPPPPLFRRETGCPLVALINSTMNCVLWCLKVPLIMKTINGGYSRGAGVRVRLFRFILAERVIGWVCEKRPANQQTQWHAGVRADVARRRWPDEALLTTVSK